MTTQTSQAPILVIGKHGKTGVRVDRNLRALGFQTRAVSRSTEPEFDWYRPDSWNKALQGVERAYVTFQPDLAIPEAPQIMHDFVAAARSAGVKHLVLLSGRGEPGTEKAEAMVRNSGLTWNIVRASWFFQNFSESFLLDGILAGELILPKVATTEPFIDADDIADVVVAALTQPDLANQVIEISGAESITFQDCVQQIEAAVGYPIKFTEVPLDAYLDGMRQEGFEDDMVWLIEMLFSEVLDGRNAKPVNGLQHILGRSPATLDEYVSKTIATGVWSKEM
ncbi:SDR family oxidoreductase [Hahella ganghwensis]|uniref:SDR family oxidoreductase n=1 Tax=Hahella ganghwensis TaxID=286420 RepID=UPI00036E6CC8|nr:NmrA family NAD(P)-binding protein [Hahella ganghwensis]